jgi:tetratricopeptide (TPR) repeat protein
MTPRNPQRDWRPVLQAGVIVLLVFVAYFPALRGGFIWDDDRYVSENPLLTAPDGLKRIWFSEHFQSQYFPLVFTTLRFEHMLWGLNPIGYHVVNVLLHGINALLVWALLRRLAPAGAWLAAAIFALHPVQVESVAWITELKNTQSTFFFLLALLMWMRFVDKETARRWRFYTLALLFYALALFSKTTACTLPAAMVLVLWLRKEPLDLRKYVHITLFLILGVAMGLLTVWWEQQTGNLNKEPDVALGGLDRLLIATHALWFYAAKLAWPANLAFSYARWDINPHDPLQYAWLAGCIVVALVLWRGCKVWGRGPIVAVVFFVATLSPMLGFFSLYTFRYAFVADHYQYAASIGLIALFAAAVSSPAVARHPESRGWKTALSVLLLLVLGVLTWNQAGVYRNIETLWRDTLAKNPNCWMAYNNLGREYARAGRLNEAVDNYRKSVQIHPGNAEGQFNLGFALASQRNFSEAIQHYTEALSITPGYLKAQYGLGHALLLEGRFDEAIVQLHKALQIDPNFGPALRDLGGVLMQEGRIDEATNCLQQELQNDPKFLDALYGLGNGLAGGRQFAEAIACYELALRAKPDRMDIRVNYGNALAITRKYDEAMIQYQMVLKAKPDDAGVHNNLGTLLAEQGRLEEAAAQYVEVIRLNPNNPETHYNLASVLLRAGRRQEAAAHLTQALQLKPDYSQAKELLDKIDLPAAK